MSAGFSWFGLLLLAGPHAWLSQSPNAPADERKWIESVVPRMADAAAQLAHARRLKRQMADKSGDELVSWRKLTVEAYQAVRVFHAQARAACGEAAFRAAEILRAAGDEAGSLAEFQHAIELSPGDAFRVRARLELGHIHRRAQRWREALAAYLDAAGDPAARGARRDDAWLWAGTAWQGLGSVEEACAAWRRVAEQGSDALARVRAYDELSLARLAQGDVEGATGELDRCLRALSPLALEETEEGERVHNALVRMRCIEELARAISQRSATPAAQGSSGKS
jgi:tetratricopeptide (TPR) repeat protein